ncbi:MAG: MDR family MFS transporter [Lachnotalea sp.]
MKNVLTKKSQNMIFTVLMISSIIGAVLQTALTTALPAIINDLQISAATAQWLTSAYSLSMGIMVPATAFLMKRFKTKPLFITGLIFFFIGLLFAATSVSFPTLLVGRILQALGSGILTSMTQVVILTIFSKEQRGTVMGIYGLAIGAAPVLAPTITGIVIDYFDWHVIFWFCLVIVAFNLVFASIVMKNVLENEKQKFDFVSMLLSTFGFSGFLLGIGNLGSSDFISFNIALPLTIGILSLIAFTIRQLHLENPFLELRTFKNKEFRLSVIMSMLLYAIMITGSTLFPLYIQIVHGLSATKSGLIMMPGSITMAIISPFAGKIYDKFGIRKLAIIGSGFMAISCLGISFVGEDTSVIYLTLFYIARLISISCMLMPLVTWGMSTLDSTYTSHGTAILTSLRTISGAIGATVFVSIMSYVTKITSDSAAVTANASGIDVAFICITIVAVLQFVLAILFVGKKTKSISEASSFQYSE